MHERRASDGFYMRAALEQAALGIGRTSPNPAVGCVIVDSSGAIIAEGYHERAGDAHAEVAALQKAGPAASGSTLYVTLEPCSHWGRTPPCVDAILKARVARVVAATKDPDPRVSGTGIGRLREAGVEVVVGPGALAARRVNEGYLKIQKTGSPFVLLKMAMTLDGKVATRTGDSRWITSTRARVYVQELRDRSDAIMIGVGTALADDPALTVRTEELPPGIRRAPRQPLRIIVDSRARLSCQARVIQGPGHCLVLSTGAADAAARDRLVEAGAEVVILQSDRERVDLRAAMLYLAQRGIYSILLEGGAELAAGALQQKVVDRLLFFVAPKIIGGREAPGPVGGLGLAQMEQAVPAGRIRIRRFSPDIALEVDLHHRKRKPENVKRK